MLACDSRCYNRVATRLYNAKPTRKTRITSRAIGIYTMGLGGPPPPPASSPRRFPPDFPPRPLSPPVKFPPGHFPPVTLPTRPFPPCVHQIFLPGPFPPAKFPSGIHAQPKRQKEAKRRPRMSCFIEK